MIDNLNNTKQNDKTSEINNQHDGGDWNKRVKYQIKALTSIKNETTHACGIYRSRHDKNNPNERFQTITIKCCHTNDKAIH